MKIKAGIIGGAGMTGGELLRILLHHENVEIIYIQSRSSKFKPIYEVHKDLFGLTNLVFCEDIKHEVDIIFLCLGHGESSHFLATNKIPDHIKIIDLSQDFRIQNNFESRNFHYGLPELDRDNIIKAKNIANPGCFATAIQLGLLPILHKLERHQHIFIHGITGSTGAGKKLQETTQHSWRDNNISAYKTFRHQHVEEIKHNLKMDNPILFQPLRGDFSRGIFLTINFNMDLEEEEILSIYQDFYHSHFFTQVIPFDLDLKMVVNTNRALIQLKKIDENLVIHVAIDNLIKGAVGQAIQNLNLMYQLPEFTGLLLKPSIY